MPAMRKLRLGPLPNNDSVKVTFSCPVSLKRELDRYAELHAQTYGEAVDAATLIPHMLHNFIDRDRTFKRTRGGPSARADRGPGQGEPVASDAFHE